MLQHVLDETLLTNIREEDANLYAIAIEKACLQAYMYIAKDAYSNEETGHQHLPDLRAVHFISPEYRNKLDLQTTFWPIIDALKQARDGKE